MTEVNGAVILVLLVYLPILLLAITSKYFRNKFCKNHSVKLNHKAVEILIGILYFSMIIIALYFSFSTKDFLMIFGSIIYLTSLFIVYLGYYSYFKHKELITKFPFNFSRNPTYFYGYLSVIGVAIMIESILLILIVVFQMILVHQTILIEEKYMQKKYGKRYSKYKKRVGRYI